MPSTRPRAMFMLDVSVAALNRGYPDWLDFMHHAGKYLRRRPEPPGVDPAADAFELLWYKTAVAMISGQRRPDFLAAEGIKPLEKRDDSASFLTEADLMNVAGRSSTTMFIVARGFGTAARSSGN